MPLPAQIGKYEILDLIGRGGMGVVYKARDTVLGRLVALKVMTSDLAGQSEVQIRFLREARSVAVLQHPNIVVVHELGEHEGNPFIAMEYLDGEPLDRLIRNRAPLTVLEKVDIILQVAKALQYAHDKGVIHRDVKPGNIMRMGDGSVKVVDFGIAHLADQTITKTGMVLGTLAYLAPEQLNGEGIDRRTDIFSLGVVLYQLLSGRLPFEGASTAEVMRKILLEAPPPLPPMDDVNRPELQPIINRALAKQRDRRYQTCAELGGELAGVRSWIELPGRPPRLEYQKRRLAQQPVARRNYLNWKSVVLAFLLGMLLLVAWLIRSRSFRPIATSHQSAGNSPLASVTRPASPRNAIGVASDAAGPPSGPGGTTPPSSHSTLQQGASTRPASASSQPSDRDGSSGQGPSHTSGSSTSPRTAEAVAPGATGGVTSGSSELSGGKMPTSASASPRLSDTGEETTNINGERSAPGKNSTVKVPEVQLSLREIVFAKQLPGRRSKYVILKVMNIGAAPLTISATKTEGDDASDFLKNDASCTGPPTQPGGECIIEVYFSPGRRGIRQRKPGPLGDDERNGVLIISDNAADSPHRVSLSGSVRNNLALGNEDSL